jgi:hypothetical protein
MVLALVDDGGVAGEQGSDAVNVALGVKCEVA